MELALSVIGQMASRPIRSRSAGSWDCVRREG
jgi:hypothetical protein